MGGWLMVPGELLPLKLCVVDFFVKEVLNLMADLIVTGQVSRGGVGSWHYSRIEWLLSCSCPRS
jgi:hypothetical protein